MGFPEHGPWTARLGDCLNVDSEACSRYQGGTAGLGAWKSACLPTPSGEPKMVKTRCLNGRTLYGGAAEVSQAELVGNL